MGNEFTHILGEVGYGIKTAAIDVEKAIVWATEAPGAQTIAVIDDVVKDSPAVRAELKTLIGKVAIVDGLLVTDFAEKGMSLPDDLATLTAIKDLISFLRGPFYDAVSVAYKDIKEDVVVAPAVQTAYNHSVN